MLDTVLYIISIEKKKIIQDFLVASACGFGLGWIGPAHNKMKGVREWGVGIVWLSGGGEGKEKHRPESGRLNEWILDYCKSNHHPQEHTRTAPCTGCGSKHERRGPWVIHHGTAREAGA